MATAGRWRRIAQLGILSTAVLSACARPGPTTAEPAPAVRVVGTFTGEVDAVTGTFAIRAATSGAALASPRTSALVEIPVVQDGNPGTGPANTVELVTERVAVVGGGCGAVDGFEGDVRLRSFYPGFQLQNAYVEIVAVTPSGHEACNSAPAVPGVSSTFGLFSYGTVTEAGTGADNALATWRFRVSDATRFTFTGRVVADLVDVAPPTSAALPAGGTFTAAQEVVLGCSDAGSGCAATYFTTGGEPPTTASKRYQGPIPVGASMTIRYFSVDAAGNAEAPASAVYVVDGVAPTVVAVSPRPQQGSVAAAAAIQVDFSEPMDPATVAGAFSVASAGGPIGGAVAQVSPSRWTFTPSTSLQAATSYVVRVDAGARDVAGNALVPFVSRFSTTTPSATVSGPGSAPYRSWGAAYDAQGNGLALFATSSPASGRGAKLLYAYYDALAGAWGSEQLLASSLSVGTGLIMPAKVVSNGSTFLAVWQEPSGPIRAVRFAGGVPGAVQDLAPAGNLTYPPTTFDVAANGSAYAALVMDGSMLKAWTHDGTSWDALGPTTLSATLYAGDPVIAPVGGTWAVAWHEYDYATHAIWTARYVPASRTWTAAVLPGTSGTAYLLPPAIASNGSAVLVGWGTTTGPTMASLDTGAGFGAAVNVSNGTGDRPYVLSAAANGTRFALAWTDRPAVGVSSGYGALFNGSSWSGGTALEAKVGVVNAAVVAPSGTGFAAALEIADSTTAGAPSSVWLNQTASGLSWSAFNLTAAESLGAHAAHPSLTARGSGTVLAWDQDDGARHQIRVAPHDGAAFGATAPIVSPGQVGGSGSVRMASNGAGDVVAVWTQDDRGARAVFASLRTGAGWGAPVRISLNADYPAVASNGLDFMIAYVELTATLTSLGVRAVPFTAGVPGAAVSLDSGGNGAPRPAVASDGSGYLVAWRYGASGTQAAIYAGATWGAAQSLAAAGAYEPYAAGHPGEYLVAWRSTSYSVLARRATAPSAGGPWTWDASTATVGTSAPTSNLAVAATATAFGLAWWNSVAPGPGGQAAVHAGGAWQAPVNTGQLPPYCSLSQIGASADGFLAVVACTDGLHAIRYAGGWSAPFSLSSTSATALAVSSDGAGYKVLARQADGAAASVYGYDVGADGVAWPGQLVAAAIAPTVALPQPTFVYLGAAFDGVQHVGAWIQRAADPTIDAVGARAAY